MVKTVITTDDIDGAPGAETLEFSVHGVHYEIDLAVHNAATFAAALKPYIDAATRVAGCSVTLATLPLAARLGPHGKAAEVARIRRWAMDNGYPVSARGGISPTVMEAFRNGHAGAEGARRT